MKSQGIIYLTFFTILVDVLLISCVESSYVTTNIAFKPTDKPRSVFDTGIFKEVELVKLESEHCVVGSIDKIIRNDSLLYIMDKQIAREVYIFTSDGRFVHKISRHGHGKNEYTQLWDIFFDNHKNALCLVSRADQKVISFGHKVSTAIGYIGYMDNYSQNPSLPYNVWTMDKSFNLEEGFLPINPQFESTSFCDLNMMSVYEDILCFKPEYSNTIYQVKDGKVSERWKLDFGEKTLSDFSSLPRVNSPEWTRLMTEKISNVYNYVETDNYLLMEFTMDCQRCIGIYNKRTQNSEIARLENYKDKYLTSFGAIIGMDQFAIYSVLDYENIYQLWLGHNKYVNFEEKFPQQVKNIRKLFPKLKEEGNPFVAIYSLK